MKRLPLFLFLALCGLSVSLAFGWWQVYQTKKQIEVQLKQNQELIYRNAALQAEIQDLKSSQDAVQERARLQLGMIKRNEVFVQVMDQPSLVQPNAPVAQPPIHKVHPARQRPRDIRRLQPKSRPVAIHRQQQSPIQKPKNRSELRFFLWFVEN